MKYLRNILGCGFADHNIGHVCNLTEKEIPVQMNRALARQPDKSSAINLSQNPIAFGEVFDDEISSRASHNFFRTL